MLDTCRLPAFLSGAPRDRCGQEDPMPQLISLNQDGQLTNLAHVGTILWNHRPGSKRDLTPKPMSCGWTFSTHDLHQQGRGGQQREKEGREDGRERGEKEEREEE